jgi:hypothetical protein
MARWKMPRSATIIDREEFAHHAFNAVFGRQLPQFEGHIADEMVLSVIETLCDQIRPEQRNWFLRYVEERMKPN